MTITVIWCNSYLSGLGLHVLRNNVTPVVVWEKCKIHNVEYVLI